LLPLSVATIRRPSPIPDLGTRQRRVLGAEHPAAQRRHRLLRRVADGCQKKGAESQLACTRPNSGLHNRRRIAGDEVKLAAGLMARHRGKIALPETRHPTRPSSPERPFAPPRAWE